MQMFKLWSAIKKDLLILFRDKAGLAVMFAMPVLLVVVITSIQNSTFEMVNDNRVPLLICNRDGGEGSLQFTEALQKIGMFEMLTADSSLTDTLLTGLMHTKDAVVAVVIPKGFSRATAVKAAGIASKALTEFGIEVENAPAASDTLQQLQPVTMFYNPVLQESFRLSVQGALKSAQQFTDNRQILEALYKALNGKKLPEPLEKEILGNTGTIVEVPVAKDGSSRIPNATQHNVPAWTIFAMFFIVVSLSTGIVKEKLSGSFIRLKTLPTNYFMALTAKQITYVIVTLLQVLVIFSLGIFLFPGLGLPQLNLPENLWGLLLVSVMCGWCAVSYGLMIGVYAKTIEQAIGFGAVSVVILAAIGGIVVPAFAMPEVLRIVMMVSPMHWCLEAYNTLFLQGGYAKDVLSSLSPLVIIIATMQVTAALGLKRQNLI
jgi:ABC-2 type transport system permease protein